MQFMNIIKWVCGYFFFLKKKFCSIAIQTGMIEQTFVKLLGTFKILP